MLALSAILVMGMRGGLTRIHSKMFGVSEAELPRLYFQFMAQYEAAIFVLNLAPYVALKLMT